MKTILVPLDSSDVQTQVLSAAEQLGRDLSATLHLLQVIEPVTSYVPVGAAMDVIAVPPPIYAPTKLDDREKVLQSLAETLRRRGLAVECQAVVGLPVDEILGRAKELKADYIVLGSHGHGALYHLFSGSVVTGVLKRAECPVVVVPGRK